MRLYHVTDRASAELILSNGFEDAEVIHDNEELQVGVWLADRCLAGEEDVGPRTGPVADVALEVHIPARLVETYQRLDFSKPYREFCIPAKLVNEFPVGGVRDLPDVDLNDRRRLGESFEAP
jgi:hypothetical protein